MAVAGGGPETGEGHTISQNTFSSICLYMEYAHKTTQGIFNFQLWLLMKWASAEVAGEPDTLVLGEHMSLLLKAVL